MFHEGGGITVRSSLRSEFKSLINQKIAQSLVFIDQSIVLHNFIGDFDFQLPNLIPQRIVDRIRSISSRWAIVTHYVFHTIFHF